MYRYDDDYKCELEPNSDGNADAKRLAELERYEILDTPPEESFDRLACLARRIFGTPIAFVNLVDKKRVWAKAAAGFQRGELPLHLTFCSDVTVKGEPVCVNDTDALPDLPACKLARRFGIRFYLGAPLRTSSGFVLGTICVMDTKVRDVDTEQVKTLEDLAEQVMAQLELRRLNRQLEATVAERTNELTVAIQVRDEFLTAASHELRTPLTSLKLNLQVIQEILSTNGATDVSKQIGKGVQSSLLQVDKLSDLVRDLLDVTAGSDEPYIRNLQETNLETVLKKVVARFRDYSGPSDSTIRLHTDGPVEIVVDTERIEQALGNLIANGMKYGRGKPIDISLRSSGDGVVLTVEDQGYGIDYDKQTLIFNCFERAGAPKHISGLGVGLYVAREIIRAHGGNVSVESTPDQGAVFTVVLPKRPRTPFPETPACLSPGGDERPSHAEP